MYVGQDGVLTARHHWVRKRCGCPWCESPVVAAIITQVLFTIAHNTVPLAPPDLSQGRLRRELSWVSFSIRHTVPSLNHLRNYIIEGIFQDPRVSAFAWSTEALGRV